MHTDFLTMMSIGLSCCCLKEVYPYKWENDWEEYNETSSPETDFQSHLNIENIADADYVNAKTVCKHFRISNLSKYHDFYLKNDTLLLVDVFEGFRNICRNI